MAKRLWQSSDKERFSKLIPRRTMMRGREHAWSAYTTKFWRLAAWLQPSNHYSRLMSLWRRTAAAPSSLFSTFALLYICSSYWLLHLLISFSHKCTQMTFSQSHWWQSDTRYKEFHLVWQNNWKESVFWRRKGERTFKGQPSGVGCVLLAIIETDSHLTTRWRRAKLGMSELLQLGFWTLHFAFCSLSAKLAKWLLSCTEVVSSGEQLCTVARWFALVGGKILGPAGRLTCFMLIGGVLRIWSAGQGRGQELLNHCHCSR